MGGIVNTQVQLLLLALAICVLANTFGEDSFKMASPSLDHGAIGAASLLLSKPMAAIITVICLLIAVLGTYYAQTVQVSSPKEEVAVEPNNEELHRMRYRAGPVKPLTKQQLKYLGAFVNGERQPKKKKVLLQADQQKTGEQQTAPENFHELYQKKDWEASHLNLKRDMNVSKLVIDPVIQRMIHRLQVALVDKPFEEFGKTVPYTKFGSTWEGYTLMFRNGWVSGDTRKPVQEEFQAYCEEIYCPVIYAMLFGRGWAEIRDNWAQFKSCTIKVCENTSFYGDNIFHMHIDGKVGIHSEKNYCQKHMSRLLFSIVTDTLEMEGDDEDRNLRQHGATAFPVWQPKVGFHNNWEFHAYMQSLYTDRGLENSGLARPHYQIPEEIVYRAVSGEVLIHKSHADKNGPQPIHSEPNPCPDRHLYVFDFNNILNRDEATGKMLPPTEVPEEAIVHHMMPLADFNSESFKERLGVVAETAQGLLTAADAYPLGRAALVNLLAEINAILTA